jgi:hypothetical protein
MVLDILNQALQRTFKLAPVDQPSEGVMYRLKTQFLLQQFTVGDILHHHNPPHRFACMVVQGGRSQFNIRKLAAFFNQLQALLFLLLKQGQYRHVVPLDTL